MYLSTDAIDFDKDSRERIGKAITNVHLLGFLWSL